MKFSPKLIFRGDLIQKLKIQNPTSLNGRIEELTVQETLLDAPFEANSNKIILKKCAKLYTVNSCQNDHGPVTKLSIHLTWSNFF